VAKSAVLAFIPERSQEEDASLGAAVEAPEEVAFLAFNFVGVSERTALF
jgi:hypothetical protein